MDLVRLDLCLCDLLKNSLCLRITSLRVVINVNTNGTPSLVERRQRLAMQEQRRNRQRRLWTRGELREGEGWGL